MDPKRQQLTPNMDISEKKLMASSKQMSNSSIPTYKFKLFDFSVLSSHHDLMQFPSAMLNHRLACNNTFLLAYGGLEIETEIINGYQVPSYAAKLWKYYFDLGQWKKVECKGIPENFETSCILLSGSIIIAYGGTEFPVGSFRSSNRVYLGNLADEFTKKGMKFKELQVSGDVPKPLFGQNIVKGDKYVYLIGGTPSYVLFDMDVYRLNLITKTWELLHKSPRDGQASSQTWYRPELVFYENRIYVFGGGQECGHINGETFCYKFSDIPMFDVETKQWTLLPTKYDQTMLPKLGYPCDRVFNSCLQYPERPNLVYIGSGNVGRKFFNDAWQIDLDTLQWMSLKCPMPQSTLLYSFAITPSGRMCCYGGIVLNPNGEDSTYSNVLTSAWVTLPKLKDICWEAMLYYFKEQMCASNKDFLKKIGLPQEYYQRIIETQ